jgi:cell division septal protein FtsQ
MQPQRQTPISGNHSLRPRPARPTPQRPAASTTQPPRRAGTTPRAPLPGGDDPHAGTKRALKALLLATVAAGSAFGVIKVKDIVETSRHLPLRTVAVVGADADVALSDERAAEVRAFADLEEGEPWLGVDTAEVAARVERHPFVREARVQRRPPDALEIAVVLRTPAAVLRDGERLYLVDDEGEVMKRVRPGDDVDAPLITLLPRESGATGIPGLADALGIIEAADRVGLTDRLSEVVAVPGAGFEVVLDDGARARLGTTDIDIRLRRLLSAEQRLKESGRAFSFMWLDDAQRPERVAVRLRTKTETSPTGG